ncbi:hypothetical protein BD324DRAFT_609369 [Kockovaella imperatae]|uniref:UBC core domain-containing protein n=1 Tax=Kockovaella imperatae TaxID=4999 RepID=A0A1Y1UC41_9TREE|nr:hypothetical protein BD324DRAFT_609369 [Kockovaella imperatae]ORX35603.1 hypothetical protein BD324DRAFT_609369 [Kockovaella imperatae]
MLQQRQTSVEEVAPTPWKRTRGQTGTSNTITSKGKGKAAIARGRADKAESPHSTRLITPVSIETSVIVSGRKGWKSDLQHLNTTWKDHRIQGYAGMWCWIKTYHHVSGIGSGDADDSINLRIKYEDDERNFHDLTIQAVFNSSSQISRLTLDPIPSYSSRRLQCLPPWKKTFENFSNIYGLGLEALIKRIIRSLQGDKDANAGELVESDSDDGGDFDVENTGSESLSIGRGFEIAKGGELDLGTSWKELKEHFAQTRVFGYRPGFTMVADAWVFSLSMPLKSMALDPNTLAIWDDGLLRAWNDDERFTLLVKTCDYPLHLDRIEYFIGFEKNYKPSADTIKNSLQHERGGMTPFYLAESLRNYFKEFPKAYKARVAFLLDWDTSDRIAFDHEESRKVFSGDLVPSGTGADPSDPCGFGFSDNLALCAFHWIVRRFVNAREHCLNCGLAVPTPALRPYVCDKPLCEYRYLTMGFGPSMEHLIQEHPGVVDLLLTFAYDAANSKTRMFLPTELNIELPIEFGIQSPKYLIDLSELDQRRAIAFLISCLPKVSEMKAAIDSGVKIKDLPAPPGAIGVLRWVVGSCRAHLKEVMPGEGALTPNDSIIFFGLVWTFKRLRMEDYGHGVYFARNASMSLGQYSQPAGSRRQNADFVLTKAVACVELVNVPETFVCCNPHYVVNKVKQIKPFLLLVEGQGIPIPAIPTTKRLFQHDPRIPPHMKPSFSSQPLEVVRVRTLSQLISDRRCRTSTAKWHLSILNRTTSRMQSSTHHLLDLSRRPGVVSIGSNRCLHLSSTSVIASKAVQRELKAVIRAQEEDQLPLYIDPDTDSLYCWTVELFDFPASNLKSDMEIKGVKSMIAELRFPASFPHSPPFMRLLQPRCLPFASGGGGHITAGGSICHEILTGTGWNPAFCIEAVVRDIMANMTEASPPARLDPYHWDRPYHLQEAIQAFKRVAGVHLRHGRDGKCLRTLTRWPDRRRRVTLNMDDDDQI